jgi:hypothetical protein
MDSALLETIAQQVHDSWIITRLNQGWAYGPQRDDQQKLHPCLVPYEHLSESEKDVDRATVKQVIEAIYQAGYTIIPQHKQLIVM